MFGYVVANVDALTPEEKSIYREYYCGLCHELGLRHGSISRITLTYDMTFLILMLSSLYNMDSKKDTGRCIPHPIKEHGYVVNDITAYAADMNMALVYYNKLDDWEDDRSIPSFLEAELFKKECLRVEKQYPRQCGAIKECLDELSRLEKADELNPDLPAACFGRLMGEVFVFREDEYSEELRNFGFALGKFIYIMDACLDLKKDIKKGSYNPMIMQSSEDFKEILNLLMADCAQQYGRLPICRNKGIIDNILYSGVWIRYEAAKKKPKEVRN
jgi:hypothetical protein